MIGKVARRGSRLGGLLRYLFGPGRAEEHRDPHLVASWLGTDTTLQADFTLDRLEGLIRQPLGWATKVPDGHVWHCAMRAAPQDPELSDEQWAAIATDVARRVGLDPGDGTPACPWVAVRHADDHIHIAAVLVREDGSIHPARGDYWAVAEARHAAEVRYGLRPTGPTDGTVTAARPTRGETEKAARAGRGRTPRQQLRDEVRTALATATGCEDFVERLHDAGVVVNLRYSTVNHGQVTGYSVGWTGDRTAGGDQIMFGGSKLAKDLSWPRVRERLDTDTTGGDPWTQVVAAADDALGELARDPATADAVAHALGDVLDAAAVTIEGRRHGPWHHAATQFDRARLSPGLDVHRGGHDLRAAARALGRAGHGASRDAKTAAAAARIMMLLLALAEARARQHRTAASAGAAQASHTLGRYRPHGAIQERRQTCPQVPSSRGLDTTHPTL